MNHTSVPSKGRHKKQIFIGIALLAILAACIAGFFLYQNSQKQAQYQGKLQTANKYLQSLDYEKAEAAYLEAIAIEPKKEKAYLKLAETYVKQDKHKKAVDILKKGKEETGNAAFESEIQAIEKEAETGSTAAQYSAYYDLCMEYREKYGEPGWKKHPFSDPSDDAFDLAGLCVTQLIDFNGDGNEELLLGYANEKTTEGVGTSYYQYEVWAWKDSKIVNVLPATMINGQEASFGWIEIAIDKEGIKYLVVDRDSLVQYLRYENDIFTSKYEYEIIYPEYGNVFTHRVNDQTFSSWEEAEFAMKKIFPQRSELFIEDEPLAYETGEGAFYIKWLYLPQSYVEAVVEDTNRVVEMLKDRKTETDQTEETR